MFYSQFILAKKGPLGTIWIAAHLERKLRKNQVADTDIGISVDSILFPDVPIALRLSSHLLLGVVRIYSRKVNYLFHDCSEALLKIKQAFRSTAVDLPPEESTAPYHSITLPETFDLDDFELPDSAFLQGSFVDHHVSTREQITLQDTMDGTGYSTSQFGLEERFGDGDASQIRLDLDEDLFMDKNPSPQPASVPLGSEEGEVHHGESSILLTSMDIDDDQNGCNGYKNLETPKDLSELLSNDCEKNVLSSMDYLKRNYDSSRQHGYNIQTPDLNEVFFSDDHIDDPSVVSNHSPAAAAAAAAEAPAPDLSECAQAPSTPGLMEEAIPANFQEIPVLSPQEKVSSSNDVEVINPDTFITPHLELEGPNAAVHIDLMHGVTISPELTDNAQAVTFLTPASELETVGLVQQCSDGFLAASGENHLEHGQKSEDNLQNGFSSEVNDNGVPRSLELAYNAQIVPSPSPALTESKPGSLVQCSYGSLAASSEAHLEHGQKSEDNLRNDFISEGNNLPSVHDNVEGILPEISCLDGLVIPSCPHEASNLESHVNKSTTDTVVVVNSNDNVLVPRVISEINSSSHENKSEPSILGNQNHLEDEDSCLTSNRSALSSDLYLRSCNSRSNQANMSSSKDGVLVENAPESSHGEPGCISETPLREEALHVYGSYAEVQGEDNCTTDSTYTMLKVQQKSEYVLSELKSCFTDLTDPDELSTGLISKDTRLDHLNYSASSEYTEPEKMLLAPSGDVDLPTGLGQLTADKRIAESAGSVDRVSSLIGKKHRLIDSTPVLQNGSSTKMSGLPRLRRNTAYIPDDDDLLASILVGRTPVLRTGPTPQPSKTASRKRPRLTHKIGVPKRKVLLDDTMILQADAMRQQLINTEDIRRMRKKAPCTRPEIWIIQKSTMEEEIFSESVFSGISAELNSLHSRRYGMDENPGSQIDADKRHSYDELSKEMEHYRNSDYVLDNNGKEMGEPIAFMSDKVNTGIQVPSGTSVSIEAPRCQDTVEFNAQEKLEPCPPQLELLNNNQTITVSTIESNLDENAGFEMPLLAAPQSGSEHEISTICRVEESSIRKNNKDDSSLEKVDRVCIHQEQKSVHELIQPSEKLAEVNDGTLNVAGSASVEDVASAEDATRCRIADSMTLAEVNDDVLVRAEDTYISKDESILEEGNIIDVVNVSCPQYCHSDVGKIENGVTSVSMLDSHLSEDRAGLPADSSTVFGHANYLIPDTAIENGEENNGEENNGVRLVSMLDSILLEDRAGLPADSSTVIGHANSPIPDMAIESGELTDLATMTSNQAMEEMKEGSLEVTLGGEPVREKVLADEERLNSEIISSEDPQVASSYPLQSFMETEHIPSAVGENSGMQECNLEGGLDVESTPMDFAMARESSDFCSGIDGNDTEFLNVDDEADFDEEDHNDVPNPEEAQSLENSGWSSRTRGVAKYLKGLFDEESGRGRKNVAVDHLLAGKTRKEASRMFFETLVLKTRDYIHVEQEDPFDSINIKPRMKLLKSEF